MSLRAENARLRQEAEHLRAEISRLGQARAQMDTVLDDFHSIAGFVEKMDHATDDAQAELTVNRKALEAVLALHQDSSDSCTHCRRPHRCPTVVAIETGGCQAREELWRIQEDY